MSTPSVSLRIPGVVPQAQFLSLAWHFRSTAPRLSLTDLILFYKANTEVRREQGRLLIGLKCEDGSAKAQNFEFFFDRFLSVDYIDLCADFTEFGAVGEVLLSCKTGEVQYLEFQAWIRATFGVASFAGLALFVRRMSVRSRSITLEQKLTFVLCASSVIGVNPFFFLFAISPSLLQDIVNVIIYRSFTVVIFLFILIVMDGVHVNHVPHWHHASQFVCFFLFLIVEAAYAILCEGSQPPRPEHSVGVTGIVGQIKEQMSIACVVWFIYLCMSHGCEIDVTERFRFGFYVFIFSVVIIVSMADRLLGR
jgi:hypothetical protein